MQAVDTHDEAPSVRSRESLVAVGFAPPTWEELVSEIAHPPHVADGKPNQPRVGWQAKAACEVESSFLFYFVRRRRRVGQVPRWATGLIFISFPTNCASRLEPQFLRVLLLRRLRLPLPLSARACQCGRGAEGSLSRMRVQESAERQVGGCELTSSETWISKTRGRGGRTSPLPSSAVGSGHDTCLPLDSGRRSQAPC